MSPQHEATILDELRRTYAQLKKTAGPPNLNVKAWSMRLTLEEVEVVLAAVDERDELRREVCGDPIPPFPSVTVREAAITPTYVVPAPGRYLITGDGPVPIPDELGTDEMRDEMIRNLPGEAVAALVRGSGVKIETITTGCPRFGTHHDCPLGGCPTFESNRETGIPDLPTLDLLPFCDCGSVDKYGDDIGEHGARCPYHLAVLRISPTMSARELDDLCIRTLKAMARAL